jgi:CHAD domain-containing protein
VNVRRLLLDALDARWRDFRAARKACRKRLSPDSVHDLRVASRRLLAFAALLRTAAPAVPAKRLRALLKEQLHALDALRDTQVMRSAISEVPFNHQGLDALRRRLARQEKRLQDQAAAQLRTAGPPRIGRKISALKKRLSKEPGSPRLVLGAVDRAFGQALARSALPPPVRPRTIHRLRIAFKKFRYQTEIVAPAARTFPKDLPKRLREFQSSMGEIQDASVLRDALAGCGCSKKFVRLAERRLASSLDAFAEIRLELSTFWRADPRASFPWEDPHEPVSDPTRSRGRPGRQARQRASAD